MFKNIFNRKPKQLELPQDWASFFCTIQEKHASIRLNLALKKVVPIEGYTEQIWFSVKFMNPDDNGFTTREEFETINAIEDTILDNLGAKLSIVFAGAIKTNGRLDMYVYTTSAKDSEAIIQATMQNNFNNYTYATNVKEDTNWEDYNTFLYPNAYELQTIQNRKVVMQLQQNGDNPELKRPVDHWADFKNKTNLNNFTTAVKAKGYTIVKEQVNNNEFKFSVNIAKEDVTLPQEVNTYVWELVTLTQEHKGIYGGWGCPIANKLAQ